ncbi:hypothetical protein ACP5PY_03210 [Photobacterium leiognathi subsp. mandapamensis]
MKLSSLLIVLTSLAYMGCGGGGSDDSSTNATQDAVQDAADTVNDVADQVEDQVEDQQIEPKFAVDDISNGYYGLIYDQDGKELEIDKDQVLLMQDKLINDVLPNLDDEQQKTFSEAQTAFEALKESEDVDKVLFKNSLIDAMLSNADKSVQDKYFPSFRLFRHHTHLLYPISRLADYSWILEFLGQRSLLEHLILIPPQQQDSDDYIETCRDNDVPIPPDWGSSDWEYRGVAETDFLGSDRTEVWAYSDPAVPGACMALPRWRINEAAGINEVNLLGIICQSQTTGKACFWDNISKETGQRIRGGEDLTFKIADIHNGDMLGENCTQCHRGKNVFLIHPGTTIDISSDYDIDPNVRYQPVSSQGWTNPPAFAELGDGACASCHEIGDLSFSYCNMLLKKAANLTMPNADNPAGWVGDDSFYGTHIQAMIDDRCLP